MSSVLARWSSSTYRSTNASPSNPGVGDDADLVQLPGLSFSAARRIESRPSGSPSNRGPRRFLFGTNDLR